MSFIRMAVWYIFFFVLQNGKDDVGEFPRNPHYRLLWFHSFLVAQVERAEACIFAYSNPCSLNDHRTKLLVASECHLSMGDLVTTAVAGRYQAEIGSKLILIMESLHIVHFC